jgi:PEP-CTERM motif
LILNLVDADTGEEATDMFGVGPHNLPEPASLVLLALGAILILARR